MQSNHQIFTLVDCNNFYCSCERAFNPKLEDKPLIVLSNNDGCAVARSEEAKRFVPMGAPVFQYEHVIRKHDIQVLSSNYSLYADMSHRVIEALSRFAPELEIYSIDESFLSLRGFTNVDLTDYGKKIRSTVKKWTGIPVSIGIGPTKTLAKIANKLAKKNPMCQGVFNIINHPRTDDFLDSVNVEDVWGVGWQYTKLLKKHGISTALKLKDTHDEWIRKHMTVQGLRTVWELRGTSCIELEDVPPDKKEIVSSRSFGKPVEKLKDLEEAVATYMTRAAEKLRSQNSIASFVSVFFGTNRFKEDEPQYSNIITGKLQIPTDYTPELINRAHIILNKIYKTGYRYKKAGVMLGGIVPSDEVQLSLLEKTNHRRNDRLMKAVDSINAEWGSDTIKYAASGVGRSWRMRRSRVSPRYTTSWNEIPVVKASFPQ
ncbi:MAG: Y-family DNA polymerase [Thermodesulfobacteriota bacterium]